MNRKIILISTIVAFAIATIAVLSLYNSKTEANNEFLVRDYSPTYGSNEAKVVLVEFFDPACGTCAQFAPLIKELVKENENRLKVVYRYAPLHKNSDIVVMFLELARNQGISFDEALNTLLSNQNLWVQNHVANAELAARLLEREVGFDVQKANLEIKTVWDTVSQDIDDMNALNISKTPTFFVNGNPLQKFGYNELKELIDSEIKKAYK
ncbi:MAG: DsbA family protein [Campylobacteraceae bacterium]|jgi:protein-disulfide isomerase|nr:DsbA family protein [Campylobacteraceae bacterium]